MKEETTQKHIIEPNTTLHKVKIVTGFSATSVNDRSFTTLTQKARIRRKS
jgi:hypothetical protein